LTRIEEKFKSLKASGGKAFVPYLTAGDPDLSTTKELILALDKAGADIIELGVPFSDPIADGPVIQRATERALAQGTRLADVLELGADIRKRSSIPLLLFSYYNPLLRYGLRRLARDAATAGFDGVLATDLTIEESGEFVEVMRQAGLNTAFLAAPTSSMERMRRIAALSTGFLYAVSRTGVTGERQELSAELREFLQTLRQAATCPIVVGFGISQPEQVQTVWREADGVAVGSAIVREIENNIGRGDLVERVAAFAAWLRGNNSRPAQ
jgi:tryptophan synthase alpha chain